MEWMLLSHTYFCVFFHVNLNFFSSISDLHSELLKRMCGTMQTPRVACEMHYMKNGEKEITFRFFSSFEPRFHIFLKYYCFLFACCGSLAIMWQAQARIAHCSVHCSCFLGVGGKTETALTLLPLLPLSPHKEHLSILLLSSYTQLHTFAFASQNSILMCLSFILCLVHIVNFRSCNHWHPWPCI